MHARETIELAVTLAARSTQFATNLAIPETALAEYWFASKARLDAWHRRLDDFSRLDHATMHDFQRQVLAALGEEIIACEVLTSVVTAIVVANQVWEAASTIVERTSQGHLEARNRVMRRIVESHLLRAHEASSLNQLRQSADRWTDRLARSIDVSRDEGTRGPCLFVREALRRSYRPLRDTPSPSGPLNARIAASLQRCFEPQPLAVPS
jgi:hypothetical protein